MTTFETRRKACAVHSIAAVFALVCEGCAYKAPRYDLAAIDSYDGQAESTKCDYDRSGPRNPEMCSASYFSDENLDSWFHVERWRDTQPSNRTSPVGLALSGGGTKSANFAIGVLAGSYESLLKPGHVGLISSVSGGGYSAFWYMSRLLDAYGNLPGAAGSILRDAKGSKYQTSSFQQIFADCLPKHYVALSKHAPKDKPDCPNNQAHYKLGHPDDFRYQTHLRGFQDLLSNNYNVEKRGNDSNALAADIAKLSGLTTLSLIPHHLANTLFDWRVESRSRETYMRGIERTFGLMPPDCQERKIQAYDGEESCDEFRLLPNRLLGRGHTFAAIRLLREFQWQAEFTVDSADPEPGQPSTTALRRSLNKSLPPVPFWIVNTTAATRSNPTELLDAGAYDIRDAVFEFTPTGFGSRRFGYWEGSHPSMDTLEATVTSGAFFDSQQRSMRQPWRAGVGLGMRMSSLEWGKDIENPAQIDSIRGWHKMLPIPLYYIDPQATGITRPGNIHLSDGGQSENTGIYSLVRRGIAQIVYADGSQDEFGQFDALCHLKLQLQKSDLKLVMESLEDFESHCASKNGNLFKRAEYGYDLWASNGRVLRGCIRSGGQNSNCENPSTSRYFSELFVLKPMLPWDVLEPFVLACKVSRALEKESCEPAFSMAQKKLPWLDPELFGFLARKRCDYPGFPQNKTWRVTLNSTSSLFGGYRELGKAYASALSVVDGRIIAADVAGMRRRLLNHDRPLEHSHTCND